MARIYMYTWPGSLRTNGQDLYVHMARIYTYKWPGSICTHGQDLYVQMARISTYKWLGFFNSTGLHLNNLNHRLVNLHCVHHTAKSDSAMDIIPLSQLSQISQESRTHHISNMHHSGETIFVACITLPSQSLWCASHNRVNLCSVHLTLQSNCTPRSEH